MSKFKLPIVTLLVLHGAIGVALAQEESPQPDQPGEAMQHNSEMMAGMMGHHLGEPCATDGMQSMQHMRGQMMKIVFAVADANGDGAVSFDELTLIHKRIFDAIDANHDGKMTADEMKTFMLGN